MITIADAKLLQAFEDQIGAGSRLRDAIGPGVDQPHGDLVSPFIAHRDLVSVRRRMAAHSPDAHAVVAQVLHLQFGNVADDIGHDIRGRIADFIEQLFF